jgi:hypothetical protein|tara:strand:- start:2451 stop:2615 length:165 start_codon:yes stop_codon:yes gene_type:complete
MLDPEVFVTSWNKVVVIQTNRQEEKRGINKPGNIKVNAACHRRHERGADPGATK